MKRIFLSFFFHNNANSTINIITHFYIPVVRSHRRMIHKSVAEQCFVVCVWGGGGGGGMGGGVNGGGGGGGASHAGGFACGLAPQDPVNQLATLDYTPYVPYRNVPSHR